MSARLFSMINLIVAAFFFLFAVVQYNDPDPLLWMMVYALAALACVLFHLKQLPLAAAGGLGALVFLLGLYLTYRVISMHQFFFDEEGREMMGSFLITLWMGVLYIRGKKDAEMGLDQMR
jgi:hypothetical protein